MTVFLSLRYVLNHLFVQSQTSVLLCLQEAVVPLAEPPVDLLDHSVLPKDSGEARPSQVKTVWICGLPLRL